MPALSNLIEPSEDRRHPIYIVLGSGGHTAEMCQMTQALLRSERGKEIYAPLRYVVASSDQSSRGKLKTAMEDVGVAVGDQQFIELPRSRTVGQSYLSSIFTTIWALLWSFWLVWRDRPRLVLCNGPGTCVPLCVAAYTWRLFRRLPPKTKIVFVESFCRVRTLSLSGRLLMPLADMVVVQWRALAERYKHKRHVKYFGRMM